MQVEANLRFGMAAGRGPPRRAAEIRRRGVGPGRMPRPPRPARVGNDLARSASRMAASLARPGLHTGGGVVAGTRHRGQHGDFHAARPNRAPAPSRPESRATPDDLDHRTKPGQQPGIESIVLPDVPGFPAGRRPSRTSSAGTSPPSPSAWQSRRSALWANWSRGITFRRSASGPHSDGCFRPKRMTGCTKDIRRSC